MDLVVRFTLSRLIDAYVVPNIDWEDKRYMFYIGITYVSVISFVAFLYLYLWIKVSKQDRENLTVRIERTPPLSPLAIMAAMKFNPLNYFRKHYYIIFYINLLNIFFKKICFKLFFYSISKNKSFT